MHKIDPRVSDELLLYYLTTGEYKGADGLDDIESYTQYGDNHDKCPFCNAESLTNRYPMSIFINTHVRSTDQFVSKKRVTVFLCNEHGSKAEKLRASLGSKSSSLANPRLQQFLATEELPDDAIRYALLNDKEDHCIFCDRNLMTKGEETGRLHCTTQHIEVGKYDKILGYVKVCGQCSDTIDNFADANYLYEGSKVLPDKCSDCDNQYPITEREYDKRKMLNTLGLHKCPDCLCDNYHMTNYERYVVMKCAEHGCSNESVLDRTLNPNLDKFWCEQHLKEEDKFSFDFGDNKQLTLIIFKSAETGLWHYILTDNVRSKVIRQSDESEISDRAEDTAFCGSLVAEDILLARYGRQKSLFP